MAFCEKCGAQLEDGVKFCPGCGAAVNATEQSAQGAGQQNEFVEKIVALNHTEDTTASFDAQDIQNNKVLAIFAYLGILVLVPLLAGKDSKFARYHANQGLVLAIAEIIYSVAYSIMSSIILAISWRLSFLVSIIGLVGVVFLVLAIIGIINVANGSAKELPVIGKIRLLK